MDYANRTINVDFFTEINFKLGRVIAKIFSENSDTAISHFDFNVDGISRFMRQESPI